MVSVIEPLNLLFTHVFCGPSFSVSFSFGRNFTSDRNLDPLIFYLFLFLKLNGKVEEPVPVKVMIRIVKILLYLIFQSPKPVEPPKQSLFQTSMDSNSGR
jgi:hypothetical protein